MLEVFGAHYVSLHVRKGNKAALGLYQDTLKFTYVVARLDRALIWASWCFFVDFTRWNPSTMPTAKTHMQCENT